MLSDPDVMHVALNKTIGRKCDDAPKPFPKPNLPYTRHPLLDDPDYEIVSNPFEFRSGDYVPVYVQYEDAADFPGLDLDGDVVKAYPKRGGRLNPLIVGTHSPSSEKLLEMFKGMDAKVIDSSPTDYNPKPVVHPLMSKLLARAK